MRHFAAYHNTEKMGHSLHEGDPLVVLTSKPITNLLGNTVWFITAEGAEPRRYALGSMFIVADVGSAADQGFKHFASGQGHVFQPPIPLNTEEWFPAFFESMVHFSVGVREIKDERVISALKQHAAEAGASVE